MNDDERGRILRMVAEGKVSPEEGADLLEALSAGTRSERDERSERSAFPPTWTPGAQDFPGRRRNRSRNLVIQIREGGESKVNVRIPLGLARTAGKFIPRQATGYFAKYDINLQEFLDNAADSEGGAMLEIKDGENKVLISVE